MTASEQKNGFIKIYRSMLDWEWWDDINTFRLFVTILMMANWKDKKWHGKKIKRGSFWTSLDTLSKRSGLSKMQVRTSLNKLESTHEITRKITRSGQLITVENYALYQDYDSNVTHDITHELTNEQHSDNTAITLTKESKESKEYKDCLVSASVGNENDLEKYDLWSKLSDNDIDRICDKYPNTGLTLIGEVAKEVKDKKREIKSPRQYVLGYATRKKWDDNQSFVMPWEV